MYAVRTTINKNGRQIVAAEGTANTTVVYAGGDQTVHGHALDTTLNGGYQYVHNGGTASGTVVNSDGWQIGKTETVLQLAELLYGGRQYLTTINMSEFQEKHTVSRLIGSPPGYVGYGEGGVLTEAIRQKPYSVVLLDEVEKAHPDVLNLFYQAFDKGEMADGEGRLIDCKNIVFFLTSNLGYQVIVEHADDPETMQEVLYPVLADFFKPALLARMEVVPYLPLSKETLTTIIDGKLARLDNVLRSRFDADVIIESEVTDEIMSRVTRAENGARMLESVRGQKIILNFLLSGRNNSL